MHLNSAHANRFTLQASKQLTFRKLLRESELYKCLLATPCLVQHLEAIHGEKVLSLLKSLVYRIFNSWVQGQTAEHLAPPNLFCKVGDCRQTFVDSCNHMVDNLTFETLPYRQVHAFSSMDFQSNSNVRATLFSVPCCERVF